MAQAAEFLHEPRKSEFTKQLGDKEWFRYKEFFEKLGVITKEVIVTLTLLFIFCAREFL